MKDLQLFEYIKEHNIGTIDELAIRLEVSSATARRRLQELAISGFINLKRGGIIEIIDQLEISASDVFKQKTISFKKQLCGKIAASKIQDGDIIFIDNGTTVREILKHIEGMNVKVYTNGIYHMLNNKNSTVDINIIPGELLTKEASIVGAEAISYLSTLNIDIAFIGANGYDDEAVYTPHRREMIVKEFALRTASRSFIVLESDKRGVKSKYQICKLGDYKLITDSDL